ncbi:unnamed protein product, partial [Didymodactylos carnosus]
KELLRFLPNVRLDARPLCVTSLDFLLNSKSEDIPIIKNTQSSLNQPLPKSTQGRVRPALHIQYPQVVTELERFLNLHAGTAQERRRTDTVHFNGVTTLQMRDRVRSTLGQTYQRLQTVYYLILYINIIDGKISWKLNDMNCKLSNDAHFASSQVKYGYELAALYPQEIISLSCDNKCKIPIGSLADEPYITLCNYLELRHNINLKQKLLRKRSRSSDPIQQKSILRQKRSSSEDKSLFSQAKMNNIKFDQKRRERIHYSTSGKSACNVYNYGQLWKKLNLDALILNSCTSGSSRYNPVERSMSPLSNWLVGLTLKREYSSNASKPHNLDDALICLNSYWDKRQYAGFQLDYYPVLSYNATGDTHTTTRLLLMKTKLDKQSNLYHDYIFLLKYCIQSHYSYMFIKCYDKKCSHCSINQSRANLTMELLSLCNNRMPVPSPSIIHPDHFNTFLQTIHALSRMTTIDNHMLKLYGSHYETYRKSKLCAAKQRESFRAQKSYLSKDNTTALAIT